MLLPKPCYGGLNVLLNCNKYNNGTTCRPHLQSFVYPKRTIIEIHTGLARKETIKGRLLNKVLILTINHDIDPIRRLFVLLYSIVNAII